MSNKYEVSAWAIIEARSECEARDELDTILQKALQTNGL